MNASPSADDPFLTKLRQEYQASFPSKWAAICRCMGMLQNKRTESPLEELRFLIHKLAGSAGTYGFSTLSQIAKEFEAEIVKAIKDPTYDLSSWKGFLDRLEKELKKHGL